MKTEKVDPAVITSMAMERTHDFPTTATFSFTAGTVSPRLSFHESIFFIIPALLTFLQVKYQSGDDGENPFATHPITMGVAVWASLVYYLACSGQLIFLSRGRGFSPAERCMLWSGNISVAALASMFAPDSIRPLVYLVSAFLSATELLPLFDADDRVRKKFYNSVQYFVKRFTPSCLSRPPPQLLPIYVIDE